MISKRDFTLLYDISVNLESISKAINYTKYEI